MIFLENLHSKVTEHGYTLKNKTFIIKKEKVINQKIRTYIKDVGEMPDEAYTRRQTDEKNCRQEVTRYAERENISTQEVISMEEYLNKRQKIREQEKKRFGGRFGEEKSPAWMMAELYV